MFTATHISNKNSLLNYIHIFGNKVSCKICPNLGASIQELSFNNINVIDGIGFSENGLKAYKETYQSAILFPFIGRIPNGEYTYKNNSYKLEINEDNRSNALHGVVYNKTFKVDFCEISNSKAKVQLSYVSDGDIKGFPFKFKLLVTYLISNKGITINFNIINQDTNSFPFGCGWHPYFKSDDLASSSLSFSSNKKLSCNDNLIPNDIVQNPESSNFALNDKSFDDTFILLKNKVNFNTKSYEAQMNYSTTHKGYLQIYTPLHRKSIAIEPVTSAPNAFNTKEDLLELKPKENYSWNIDLTVKIHE